MILSLSLSLLVKSSPGNSEGTFLYNGGSVVSVVTDEIHGVGEFCLIVFCL
jgi:hypothetical protein